MGGTVIGCTKCGFSYRIRYDEGEEVAEEELKNLERQHKKVCAGQLVSAWLLYTVRRKLDPIRAILNDMESHYITGGCDPKRTVEILDKVQGLLERW
jgi:hypothetical protein